MNKKQPSFFYGFPAEKKYIADADKETITINTTYTVTFHRRNYRIGKSNNLVRSILEQFDSINNKLLEKKCNVVLNIHKP